MIRSGDLRTQATLQRWTQVPNDSGGTDNAWVTVGTPWCQNVSATSRELREAQKLQTTVTHAIKLRYNETITPQMRLVIGDLRLHIESVVDPDWRRREMIAMCSGVQPNG